MSGHWHEADGRPYYRPSSLPRRYCSGCMRPALLLVDLQRDFLRSTGLQPSAEHLIGSTARLLETFRRARAPVLHVFTTTETAEQALPHWRPGGVLCLAGTPGHGAPPTLHPANGVTVLH